MSIESMAHVLRHSRAKGTAKLVLVGIANHDGDGGAWPSINTLTMYANADRRTVQRAIRDLVTMGELVVHEQDGGTRSTRDDRRPNRYTITVSARVTDGAASTPPRGGDGAAPMTERGGAGVAHGAAPTPPEPSLEPSSKKTSPSPHAATTPDAVADALAIPVEAVDGFDVFWAAYPRKDGKAEARKSWRKAITKERAADIVAAATRYAADPNREPAFTAFASTWLNQERWNNGPLPARAGRVDTTRRVAQGMDVVRRMAEAEGVDMGNVRMIGGGR